MPFGYPTYASNLQSKTISLQKPTYRLMGERLRKQEYSRTSTTQAQQLTHHRLHQKRSLAENQQKHQSSTATVQELTIDVESELFFSISRRRLQTIEEEHNNYKLALTGEIPHHEFLNWLQRPPRGFHHRAPTTSFLDEHGVRRIEHPFQLLEREKR